MYQEHQGRFTSEFGISKENFDSKILRENDEFGELFPQIGRAF